MRAVLLVVLLSIAAMTLPGCRGASAMRTPAPIGQPIRMAPGQQIAMPDGATLGYLRVAADSRCPPGVQCIHAGDADVVFEFAEAPQVPRRITVNTDRPITLIGKWQLRLLALAFGESPGVTVQIEPHTP